MRYKSLFKALLTSVGVVRLRFCIFVVVLYIWGSFNTLALLRAHAPGTGTN